MRYGGVCVCVKLSVVVSHWRVFTVVIVPSSSTRYSWVCCPEKYFLGMVFVRVEKISGATG
jgi:hypothetical protein